MILVTMTPESGGWIMRRWEKCPKSSWDDGRLRETHVSAVPGTMYAEHPQAFRVQPDNCYKLEKGTRA